VDGVGIRMKDEGLGGFYHLRETKIPYNSDFTPENSDLRAENTFFSKDNHYILIR